MKINRLLAIFLVVILTVLSASPAFAAEKVIEDLIKGDFDGDKKITTLDALYILQYEPPCPCQKLHLDPTSEDYGDIGGFPVEGGEEKKNYLGWYINVDNDFEITAADALLVLQFVVKKVDRFGNYFMPYDDGTFYICDSAPDDFVPVKWWEN